MSLVSNPEILLPWCKCNKTDFSSPFIFVIKERQEKHNIPMTVVVPRGATNEAGEKPYAEKFPISPRTIKVRPTLII